MFTALTSLLGGSAFRMIWGEVSAFFTAKQQHKQEMERLNAQESIDAAQHSRNLESLRVQNELGIKTIQIQGDADMSKIEGNAWASLVESTTRMTGIKFVDIWNGVIRPMLATLAIAVVVFEICAAGFILSDWDRDLVAAILGIYLADRGLSKRGK